MAILGECSILIYSTKFIRECGSTPYVGMTHPLNINNDRLTSLFHGGLYKKPVVKRRVLTKNQLHHSTPKAKTGNAKKVDVHHHNLLS